jgi:hypothetical protein
MKRYLIILTIDKESFDYDMLLTFFRYNNHVDRLCILPQGFFIIIRFDDNFSSKKLLSGIIKLDIEDITLHKILYEQFIPKYL